jgi:tetratricopeptide (TPR) repeat protein
VARRWGKKKAKQGGAALIVLEGPDKGEEHPIVGEVSLGRTQDNTLVRLDRGVSRHHCVIRDEGGVFTIEDRGSANGTLVNDRKTEGLEVLRHGDRVLVGETTFLFHWPEGQVDGGLSTSPGIGRLGEDTQPGAGATGTHGGAAKKPRRRRALLLGALAVVVLLVILGFAARALVGDGEALGPTDSSEEPVRYSDSSEFRQTAFGYGEHDDAHPDKAIIRFDYLKGRATLRYSAWGIDDAGEVVIRLNGKQIGEAPTTQEYRHEIYLELPRDLLVDGENELELDNTKNPPGEDRWEVGFVRIVHEPLLPPDPEEAQAQYQQALRYYEDREVDPQNRFRAFQKLRLVRDLLEQAQPRPPLYGEASAMMERIMAELQDIFELGRFSAERAYRFEDDERAQAYLRRTIRYFPDPDDVRREQLALALEALGGE